MEGYIIRPAIHSDIPEMTRLLGILFSIETDFVIDSEKQKEGLGLILDRRDFGIIFVAVSDGKVIGMITGQTGISTAEGGLSVRVEDVVIDENFRKRGVGGKLLAELSSWAFQKGAKRMELLADRMNISAIKFYQNRGWRETKMICLHKKSL